MRIWTKIRSRNKIDIYSLYVDINDKTKEVYNFGCTCKWGSYYGWSKKNGRGTKPCKHLKRLIELIKNKIKEENEKKIK